MVHLGTVTLETPRLLLRRFTAEDALMIFANWAHDCTVTQYLTWSAHDCVQDTEALLAEWLSRYSDPAFYHWAIVLKSLGQPVGTVSAVRVHSDTEQIEVGYCLGRQWWHQRIMSEALQAVLRFWLLRCGINQVEGVHDTDNPRSGAVMQRCGMTFEGILRQAGRRIDGRLADLAIYSILAEDFQSA